MIRLYRNCSFFSRKHIRMLVSIQQLCTFAYEIREKEPEINYVKLIGTVHDDSTKFTSGSLSCKIIQRWKSPSGQPFLFSHMLTIKPKVQRTSGLTSLMKGQRVNVNGYIRSLNFKISSNQTRTAIAIVPYDINLMSDDDPLQDNCIVMIAAYIESKIKDDGTCISFSLRTHMPLKNVDDKFTGETTMHSHSVKIIDSKLQRYVRSHITQYDQIFLEGHLYYRPVELENGKKRICGNINPIHIEKI